MPEKSVAYSAKKLSLECGNCGEKTQEIVQTQRYIGLGSIRFWGIGPRKFKMECLNCGNISELNEQQIQRAQSFKYAESRNASSDTLLSQKRQNRKYPVLDEERREAIWKENRKEGLLSMAIGTVIGILIIPLPFEPWSRYIGLGIIIYSILGGLYAIFEDPERKHRFLIDKKKDGTKLK